MWNSLLALGLLGSLPLASTSALPRGVDILPRAQSSQATPHALSSATPAPTRSHPVSLPHSSYTGSASTTGALTASSIGKGISEVSIAPSATTYPSDGKLHNPEPAPYVPAGGVGTSGSIPVYNVRSDFDYESLALALYQEWIELDLFQDGLRRFTADDFSAANLSASDRELIAYMSLQEEGHATLVSNMLGAEAPQQCAYEYPYTNVAEFIDFTQKLTRVGEAGVYGFLAHLDSREASNLLTQSISVEARQQFVFRQFQGLHPMPEWFEVGIPQSWAWTLLAPYISWCPANQTRLAWQNFPALTITDQPTVAKAGQRGNVYENNTITPGTNVAKADSGSSGSGSPSSSNGGASVATDNHLPLSYPGRQVGFTWDAPGKKVGPNNSYVTTTQAGDPKYVIWVSQLNVTYTTLRSNGSHGVTVQPDVEAYMGDPLINGTIFVALTDAAPPLVRSTLA
ncbi:Protein rds1 [Penicillium chermesinum]|uniref:Protein rds1 n=1 Tax=Penicillium chermesinum TaxID=63820 RepID=A0A9W9PGR7_9EURO|nr:Protein rds1 [Penicillium chermesinum]KAJ5246559.1 Protein rds1 [Penicillium chermesinum]